MSILDKYFEKYQTTTPEANPIGYQLHKDFTGEPVSEEGKIYWKRGRMHDDMFVKRTEAYYAVPMIYDQPEGFRYKSGGCWRAISEMFAVRYYRKYGRAQHKLKAKFDAIIKGQDELYELSKAVDCDVELPNGIKEGFVPRPHQLVAIKFGKLTNGCFILADQQRVGKSVAALLYVMSQNWERVLIISPSKVCP